MSTFGGGGSAETGSKRGRDHKNVKSVSSQLPERRARDRDSRAKWTNKTGGPAKVKGDLVRVVGGSLGDLPLPSGFSIEKYNLNHFLACSASTVRSVRSRILWNQRFP